MRPRAIIVLPSFVDQLRLGDLKDDDEGGDENEGLTRDCPCSCCSSCCDIELWTDGWWL